MHLEFIVRAMLAGIAPCFVLFVLVVRYQQSRARRNRRRRKKLRFYPTNTIMGLAFQNLQVFVHPEIDYTLQEKYKEAAEEEKEGDPESPQRALARQMRRIRNGERVDCLQVPAGRGHGFDGEDCRGPVDSFSAL